MSEKTLMLKPVGPCYSVYWDGGGEVPKALAGLYTSRGEAQKAINTWQNSKPVSKRRTDSKAQINGAGSE